MLFDLRSRGRRRTVQVIYIGLAVLIAAGLVLFGVGTGTGGGGLLGGVSGSNNNAGSGNSTVTAAVSKAVKQAQKQPTSAAAWANLVSARYSAANAIGYVTNTNTFTTAGKQQLTLLAAAYTRYEKLVSTPGSQPATYAARAYGQLGQYASAAAAWQAVLAAQPGDLKGLECVAYTSYAAKNDRVAQLAEAHFLARIPKSGRKTLKTQIESAKTSPAVAASNC